MLLALNRGPACVHRTNTYLLSGVYFSKTKKTLPLVEGSLAKTGQPRTYFKYVYEVRL